MISHQQALALIGQTLWALDGKRVGVIGQVFINDHSHQPQWLTVHTGLFGTKERFVPLAAASVHPSGVNVPYPQALIKTSPLVEDGLTHLSPHAQTRLQEHYHLKVASPQRGAAQQNGQDDDEPQGRSHGSHPLVHRQRLPPLVARGTVKARGKKLRRLTPPASTDKSQTSR